MQFADLEHNDEPTVFNLGVSGDSSDKILRRIEHETIARTWEGQLPVVVVQIGLNDSSFRETVHENNLMVAYNQYAANLHMIARALSPLYSSLIFVGASAVDESMTRPWSDSGRHWLNQSIHRYELSMRDVAAELEIPFIPLFERFKEALDNGHNFLSDGLHPNEDGHQFIADIVLPALNNTMSTQTE